MMDQASDLHANRGGGILATCIVVISLNILIVILRIVSRFRNKTALWWDDWAALLALPFSVGQAGAAIYWVSTTGLGKHQDAVETPSVSKAMLATFVYQLWYIWALLFVKLSAILFYGRCFGLVRWYRITLWIAGLAVLAWAVGVTFLTIFACVPVERFWTPGLPGGGSCVDEYSAYLGSGIPNALTDLVIVLLPLPMVLKLQTNAKHRLALCLVFFCSYATVAVSISRTVLIATEGSHYSRDYDWYPVNVMILAVLQPGLGLICVCLPAIIKLSEIWAREVRIWRETLLPLTSNGSSVAMNHGMSRNARRAEFT